jgi:hypothetical protein
LQPLEFGDLVSEDAYDMGLRHIRGLLLVDAVAKLDLAQERIYQAFLEGVDDGLQDFE